MWRFRDARDRLDQAGHCKSIRCGFDFAIEGPILARVRFVGSPCRAEPMYCETCLYRYDSFIFIARSIRFEIRHSSSRQVPRSVHTRSRSPRALVRNDNLSFIDTDI
jgi:hypothetical protein